MNTCRLLSPSVSDSGTSQRKAGGDQIAATRISHRFGSGVLENVRVMQMARNLWSASLVAGVLTGCVATVRVPVAPAPAPVYVAPAPVAAPVLQAEVQATDPPPPIPEYEQPPCPEDGWLWTPGYWAFASGGYYWVPGTWVAPPSVGVVWTPGYWAFTGGVYRFHAGYWGPHVGFYGGVNYGYGYAGSGFVGGMWVGNHFTYNTAVVNVNTTVVHNTYVNSTVVNNVTVNRVSYNGPGGVQREPTPSERAAMNEPHVPPTLLQTQHYHEAVRNPQLAAKANGGHPPIAATTRPAAFTGPGAVGAKGAPLAPAKSVTDIDRTPLKEAHPVVAPVTHPVSPISAPHSAATPVARAPLPNPVVRAGNSAPARKGPEKKPEKSERPR